jgi:hypothetical protein
MANSHQQFVESGRLEWHVRVLNKVAKFKTKSLET